MNKIIRTHGGQRQVVAPDGEVLAADMSSVGDTRDGSWFHPWNGNKIHPDQIIDMLAPPLPRTLVAMIDVTGLSDAVIEAVVQAVQDATDAVVTATLDQVVYGDHNHALGALSVGLGQ